jgi:ferredoxin/flavodoxin---NADP+ reductase
MSSSQNHPVQAVAINFSEQLSPGFYLIGFKRSFNFVAGQVIGISLREDNARRLYSICSGENEEEIRILYKVVEDGYLTPQLSDLEAGDTIWISPPGGVFTSNTEPAIWIATGTGIAPFYSMVRSGLGKNKILLEGNRYLEQFHFYEEFSEILGDNYIRCCSKESNESVYAGRVSSYLEEQADLNPDLKYYICGSAEMVVEIRDLLIGKGIPFSHIISEIYF